MENIKKQIEKELAENCRTIKEAVSYLAETYFIDIEAHDDFYYTDMLLDLAKEAIYADNIDMLVAITKAISDNPEAKAFILTINPAISGSYSLTPIYTMNDVIDYVYTFLADEILIDRMQSQKQLGYSKEYDAKEFSEQDYFDKYGEYPKYE